MLSKFGEIVYEVGVPPVFIGDMEGDYEAARVCELEFYQVTYGFGLPMEGCKTIESFPELVEKLINK